MLKKPRKTFDTKQFTTAQWLAWRLATSEVPGSNPGKGDNLKISDYKEFQLIPI